MDMQSTFSDRKVLITGGLGFIGSTLAIRLASLGAHITLVDSLIPEYGGCLFNIEPVKEQVHVNISDVRDEHAMKILVQGQDFLFNLAGQTSHLDSMNNPFPDLEINARAQLFILEACRHYNPQVKIIFASTRQIYGKPQYLPVDENHPIQPVDINGINKLAGEWYHLIYHRVYGMHAVVLRLTNTYGARMRVKDARQTFLGIWIRRLIEGRPLQIYGDGKQLRDFNYVDDVIDALLLSAASPQADGEIYNLGYDHPRPLLEIAKLLIDIHGEGDYQLIEFPPGRKSIDIGDYYGNFSKIHEQLEWTPHVDLQEGFRRTLDYYLQYQNQYWNIDLENSS